MRPIAITGPMQKRSRSSLNDIGTRYRSAIFYTTDAQRRIAEDTIADVDESGLWPDKVVTEVVPAATRVTSFAPTGGYRFARLAPRSIERMPSAALAEVSRRLHQRYSGIL